jgi:hypothetical protein
VTFSVFLAHVGVHHTYSYVGISMNVFAVGVSRWSYFLASDYGSFLLVIRMNLVIRNGPSTYLLRPMGANMRQLFLTYVKK